MSTTTNDSFIPFGTDAGCETEHLLRIEGLHVHYGKICALHDVSLETRCGRALALLGKNGAGKSTLLKAIAGLQPEMHGRILWGGAPIKRKIVAYLPQREEVDWNFPFTVRGLIETGRYPLLGPWKRFSKRDDEVVEQAIESMELKSLEKRQIRKLSGGQQQRTFIARALAQEAHVLLLDEPFAGLDQPSMEHLSALLSQLVNEGRLVIASHHDLGSVREIFDDVLLLNRSPVAFGPVETCFTDENIEAAYAAHAS